MAQGGMGRLVEELAGEALNNHLRNVRSYSELRRRVSEGSLTEREVNEAYSRYARDHAADYRKEASDLTIRYYQELSELGARFSEQFYEDILNGHGPGSENGHRPPVEPDEVDLERVPIELHGRAGTEIVGRFTLENTDPTPTSVRFRFEPCQAPHGETFHAPITVQPAEVELEPGGKAEILLRAALMPSVFVPGLIYRQTIIADGGRPLALDLTLWVEADDDPVVRVAPTPAPTSTGPRPADDRPVEPVAPTPAPTSTRPRPADDRPVDDDPVEPVTETKAPTKPPATRAAKKPATKKPATKGSTKKTTTKGSAKKTTAAKRSTKKAAKKRTTTKASAKKAAAKKSAAKRSATPTDTPVNEFDAPSDR